MICFVHLALCASFRREEGRTGRVGSVWYQMRFTHAVNKSTPKSNDDITKG